MSDKIIKNGNYKGVNYVIGESDDDGYFFKLDDFTEYGHATEREASAAVKVHIDKFKVKNSHPTAVKKMSSINSGDHMEAADDENTVDSSNSMKDVSDKIQSAGGTVGVEEEEEITLPEPRMKTTQEMLEDPKEVSDQHEDGHDALPVDQKNPEQLESVKNPNADGDEQIKKEQLRMASADSQNYRGKRYQYMEEDDGDYSWWISGQRMEKKKANSRKEAMDAAEEYIDGMIDDE